MPMKEGVFEHPESHDSAVVGHVSTVFSLTIWLPQYGCSPKPYYSYMCSPENMEHENDLFEKDDLFKPLVFGFNVSIQVSLSIKFQ